MALETLKFIDKQFLKQLNEIVEIDPRYKARVSDGYIELEMVEEGERIFGSTIDIYTRRDWETKKRQFKINAGSMGAFDLSCEASVGRYLAMAELIKNFEKVVLVCFSFCNAVEEVYKNA